MTDEQFAILTESLPKRFPWVKVNDESSQKLWHLFGNFTLEVVQDAMHAYDIDHPDLDARTFKLSGILKRCFDAAQAAQAAFKWTQADEGWLARVQYDLRRVGKWQLAEDVRWLTMTWMGFSRVPSEQERESARKVLVSHGAKTVADVEETNRRNNLQYDAFRRRAAEIQAEMSQQSRKRVVSP